LNRNGIMFYLISDRVGDNYEFETLISSKEWSTPHTTSKSRKHYFLRHGLTFCTMGYLL